VWIKAKGLGEPLRPHNVSDGTLRALAIASALYGGSSLVVLEEPENCVHPHLLEALMSLARDSPPQVILTTHSPYLLDHARPEEVYVVEKEGLETKVGRLSAMKELKAVRRFLEEGGTLGEAWYSGMMGGTP
jgi:predicted ATPase